MLKTYLEQVARFAISHRLFVHTMDETTQDVWDLIRFTTNRGDTGRYMKYMKSINDKKQQIIKCLDELRELLNDPPVSTPR